MTRRTVIQLASSIPFLAAGSLLSGCPQRTQYTSPKGIDKGASGGIGNARQKPTKVGLVTDIAGVNDKSFNAMAAAARKTASPASFSRRVPNNTKRPTPTS